MKKNLKNKIVATSAMVGAVIAAPAIVGVLDEQMNVDLAGKVGLDQLGNKALAFAGGTGIEAEPYVIESVADFKTIGTYPAGTHFILGSNIDLSGEANWTPINLTGITLDGGGQTISNLVMSQVFGGAIFGEVLDSTITNLNIDGVEIVGQQTTSTKMSNSGSLAVFAENSKFEKIFAKNVKIHDKYGNNVGGLIGEAEDVELYQIAVESDIQFDSGKSLGGVVGKISHTLNAKEPNNWKEVSSKSKILNFTTSSIGVTGGLFGTISILGSDRKDLPVLSDVISNVDFEIGGGLVGGIFGRISTTSSGYSNADDPLGKGENLRIDRAVVYGNAKQNYSKGTRTKYYDIGDGNTLNIGTYSFVTLDRYSKMLSGIKDSVTRIDNNLVKYQSGEMGKEDIYTPFGFDFNSVWKMDSIAENAGPRLEFHDIKNSSIEGFEEQRKLYSGGSGTIDDPYIIYNERDLDNIRYNLDAHYLVDSNISLNGKTFEPIGNVDDPFTGTVKGFGYAIQDFVLPTETIKGEREVGLFGYTKGAKIEGVTVKNVKMEGLPGRDKWSDFLIPSTLGTIVGGLIGKAVDTDINNVGAEGDFEIYGSSAGALIGVMAFTKDVRVDDVVVDISDESVVLGRLTSGGFVGKIEGPLSTPGKMLEGQISNVSVKAPVYGRADVGGFAGYISGFNLLVKDVMVEGTVENVGNFAGFPNVGGFVGLFLGRNSSFENIITYNSVLAGAEAGGFAGHFSSMAASQNKFDGIFAANGYANSLKPFSHFTSLLDNLSDEKFNEVGSNIFAWTDTNVNSSAVNESRITGMFTTKQLTDKKFFKDNSTINFNDLWEMRKEGPALKNSSFIINHQFSADDYDSTTGGSSTQFAGGTGSSLEPYLIETAEQLGLITSMPTKHFKLISNINLDSNFTPISPTTATEFEGTFDGGGYSISGLDLVTKASYQGLFGYVAPSGVIKNLEISNPMVVSSHTYSSFLVGKLEGTVENVTIRTPRAELSKNYFGAIAGLVSGNDAVIKDVFVFGLSVNAPDSVDYVGGVAGNITGKAYVDGVVSDVIITAGEKLGGFAGKIGGSGVYNNIQTFANISGLSYLGGYAGDISSSSTHQNIIVNGSKVGGNDAVDYVGGFAGDITSTSTTVKNVIVDVEKVNGSKVASVGKFAGDNPKSMTLANIGVNSSMSTNGHSTNVQFNLSDAQLKDKATYERFGFTFGGKSKWLFYKNAGVPTLKYGASYLAVSNSSAYTRELWTSTDDYKESVASDHIDYAIKNKNLQYLTVADGYVDRLSNESVNKSELSNRIESERAYLEAIQDLKELAVNKDVKTLERIQENMVLISDSEKRNEIQLGIENNKASYDAQQILINTAKAAVEKAETTKAYNDIMYAEQALTLVVTNSKEKIDLLKRLTPLYNDAVESNKIIEFIDAIEAGLISKDLESVRINLEKYKNAYDKVLNPDKHNSQIRKYYEQFGYALSSSEVYNAAEEAVKKAEEDLTKESLDKAKIEVGKLPEGDKKNELIDKLQDIEERINDRIEIDRLVKEALDKVDKSLLDKAKEIYDGFTNPRDIEDYKNVISDASKIIEAIDAAEAGVAKVEKSLENIDVTSAQLLIDKIPTDLEIAIVKKGELQDRLDAVKAAIIAKKEFEKTEDAVSKAEESKDEVDIKDAQDKIDALPEGKDKDDLQDRLDNVKDELSQAEADKKALAEATKAVEKAESTKTTVDVDDAQKKVTALKDSPEKDALQDRLDSLKAEIEADGALEEATKAVEKAEGSKTLVDIDDAQAKVTALKDSPEKQALQDRLDKLKAEIEAEDAKQTLEEAIKAVEKAESTKKVEDINDAQLKVTDLSDGKPKQDLQDRLDALKNGLEENENNKLALEEATKAVEKAESTKATVDIETAQTKVTALKDSSEKDALQDRLDKLKAQIEAENKVLEDAKDAVEKAESSKNEVDIKDAQDKIDALPEGKDKDDLQDRLDNVKDELSQAEADKKALAEATKAVEKAESTKTTVDVDDAQKKVTALKDSPEKDALQDRLDKLKKELDAAEDENKALEDAKDAVKKAESSKDKNDIKDAQDKIDVLPDGKERSELQDRLDKVKEDAKDNALFEKLAAEVKSINKGILDGKIRVNKFEKTKTKLESIRQEGTAIKDTDNKEQLNTLIDATLALMNLVEKIEAGDKSPETIDQLPDSKIKDDYLSEIAAADAIAQAEKAVVQAEKTIELADIEAAEDLVSKLAPSDAKRELKERLNVVKEKYEEAQAILEATKLVEAAEESLRSSDISRAEKAVKQLKDGAEKTALEARIEAIYKKVGEAAYNAALQAVEKAEELRTKNSITYAKDKVADLRDSEEKMVLEKRIAALEKAVYDQTQMDRLYNQALAAVEKAEKSSIIAYLSTAIKLTNKVSDADERKAGLENRIEAIQLRNLIASTEAELNRLEQRPSQVMVEKVEDMIELLPDTVDEKEGFITRLDAVKQLLDNENYAKALKAVVFAEKVKIENKRAAYYDALPLVDVVLDSVRKTVLEERLIAILKEVEAYERMDGDYNPGDDIVKSAESIKDSKVKKYLLDWAKAIVNAEVYYGGTLSKALAKEKASVPADVMKNEKYADLIGELNDRTLHIEQSKKVFGRPGQSAVKKAYVAVLKFEQERSEFNRKDAVRWVESLSKYKNSSLQIEKFMERINRIEVVKNEK